jgi:KDO2-lipid IV(A) lauroyltransferase
MDFVLYILAKGIIALAQALPLPAVVRLGRAIGALVYYLDARHRRVALRNLTAAFAQEKTAAEIRALALENFRRIGENFGSAMRTSAMSDSEVLQVLTVAGAERLHQEDPARSPSRVMAIGHFGNFELYARAGKFVPGLQFATTYRALRQPGINRLMQEMRERSGCLYFERRTDGQALRDAMNRQRLMIGFLADQHAGDKGLRLPFFGRDCATSTAPAVFALRYHCALHTAVCYRVAPGKWHIEIGEEIPTREGDQPRSVEAITLDVNRAFEAAVRRDPANWFWVHNRWKAKGRAARSTTPAAPGGNEA